MNAQTEKFAAVDDVDREILDVLQRDARISFSDLAARVSMSPNAVAERVRRLQSTGAIVASKINEADARQKLNTVKCAVWPVGELM